MSKSQPRPARHLQVFAICLVVLVAALGVFLFGVKMEDTAPGKGVITSGKLSEIRAPQAGQVELTAQQNHSIKLHDTIDVPLAPGLEFPRGHRLAWLHPAGSNDRKQAIPLCAAEPIPADVPEGEVSRWRVVEVLVRDGDFVHPAQPVVRLVEFHPKTGEFLLPLVRLDIEEKHFGEVAVGQEVRIYSNMYHHRTHGVGRGRIERLEPFGEPGPNGSQVFHAWVAITESPFPLKLGSSVRAEVLLGRKPTYRIILEH